MITQERLKELVTYDEITGIFKIKKSRSGTRGPNGETGTIGKQGYAVLGIDYKSYKAHRLAWLYVHGRWPTHEIDHINGVRTDNRLVNLREVDGRTNCQNRVEHRNGHVVGTHFFKRTNSWQAYININRVRYHLGYFKTQEEAHAAYLKKLEEHNKKLDNSK